MVKSFAAAIGTVAKVVAPTRTSVPSSASAWAQMWTTTRFAAEFLAVAGRPADAAFLLGAAAAAPSTPPPVGQDIERYAALHTHLSRVLGPVVHERICAMAMGTPRAQVVTRAQGALSEPGSVRS